MLETGCDLGGCGGSGVDAGIGSGVLVGVGVGVGEQA